MLKELNDYDWKQVFEISDLEILGNAPNESPTRENVSEIIAIYNGWNDGDDWCGVFKMKNGSYLAATGGCDYTGWG